MKPQPYVRPPSVTAKMKLPDAVDWIAVALSAYVYGWSRPGALPARPDSLDYMRGAIHESLEYAEAAGVRNPDGRIDPFGVPVLSWHDKPRTLHLYVPCSGVIRWSKLTGDPDTGSEGTAVNYSVSEMTDLFTDLIEWLTCRSNPPVVYPPKRVKRVKD